MTQLPRQLSHYTNRYKSVIDDAHFIATYLNFFQYIHLDLGYAMVQSSTAKSFRPFSICQGNQHFFRSRRRNISFLEITKGSP